MPMQMQPLRLLEVLTSNHLPQDKSPFLVLFEYGENREGYWAYNNMVLQFEDAVDVLQVMHHRMILSLCLTTVAATQKKDRMV